MENHKKKIQDPNWPQFGRKVRASKRENKKKKKRRKKEGIIIAQGGAEFCQSQAKG